VDQTQVVHVDIAGLNLEPRQAGTNSNETYLQVYYLTVKAVTASGQYVTASSAGVYVDTTPPVIEMLYHVDMSWNQDEPSNYQGDNSTIAMHYQAFDGESEVKLYFIHSNFRTTGNGLFNQPTSVARNNYYVHMMAT